MFILSNLHDESLVRKRQKGRFESFVNKPVSVDDYNKYMGGVDKCDRMIQPYDATRKTMKWYRKLAIHLIQLAMLNSFIVYQKSGGKSVYLKFQSEVIASLLFQDNPAPELKAEIYEDVSRLTERHFIKLTPERVGENVGTKKRLTRRCRVCSKNGVRREVIYLCSGCPSNPPLCAYPCFEKYHTLQKYWD